MRGIGWFGEDIVDFAAGAVSSVVDVTGDVLAVIPGSEIVTDAVSDVWTGPLRDFAKTPVGVTVLTGVVGLAYGPLGYALGGPYGVANFGAQLATVTWALPGVARGESFSKAWTEEVIRRAEQTAEQVAPELGGRLAHELVGQLATAAAFIDGLAPGFLDALAHMPTDLLEEEIRSLARSAGVADWSLAMALSTVSDLFPGPADWKGVRFDAAGAFVPIPRPVEWALLYDPARDRVWRPADLEVSQLTDRSRFEAFGPRVAPPPPPRAAASFASPPLSEASAARKRSGDLLLVLVIAAAGGSYWWWRKKQRHA